MIEKLYVRKTDNPRRSIDPNCMRYTITGKDGRTIAYNASPWDRHQMHLDVLEDHVEQGLWAEYNDLNEDEKNDIAAGIQTCRDLKQSLCEPFIELLEEFLTSR